MSGRPDFYGPLPPHATGEDGAAARAIPHKGEGRRYHQPVHPLESPSDDYDGDEFEWPDGEQLPPYL